MGLTASQPEENTEQQGHIVVYDGGINGGYNRVGKCPVWDNMCNITFKYLLEIISSVVAFIDPGIMWKVVMVIVWLIMVL